MEALRSPLLPQCGNYPKKDKKLCFGFLKEASLRSRDKLNHWPLATDSTFSPFPLPGSQGVGLKAPTWLILLANSSHPVVTFSEEFSGTEDMRPHILLFLLRKFQGFEEL